MRCRDLTKMTKTLKLLIKEVLVVAKLLTIRSRKARKIRLLLRRLNYPLQTTPKKGKSTKRKRSWISLRKRTKRNLNSLLNRNDEWWCCVCSNIPYDLLDIIFSFKFQTQDIFMF